VPGRYLLRFRRRPTAADDDERKDGDEELVVGVTVEADCGGKGKWRPGRITRARLNGTFDIDYDDGESEQSVPRKSIRTTGRRSHSSSSSHLLKVGTAVEANYRGKGRYFPGKISRVHKDDNCYDIDYDDGETENDVPRKMIRVEERFERDDKVFARKLKSKTWEKAIILNVRPDKTYDVEFDKSGDIEKSLPSDHIRSSSANIQELRAEFLGRVSATDKSLELDNDLKFRAGSRVACYWYRTSKFGRAREQLEPKSCIVLAHNPDSTYTVELEEDNSRLDDVPEDLLKLWGTATADLKARSLRGKTVDPWEAVLKMAKEMQKQGKIPERQDIPTLNELSRKHYDAQDNLERIFGSRYLGELKEEFSRQDRYEEDEISIPNAVKGFKALGRAVDEISLTRYLMATRKETNKSKNLTFLDFVMAFANLSYGPKAAEGEDTDEMSDRARDQLRRSLRLDRESAALSEFAVGFGAKLMRELERAFDKYAIKGPEGREAKLRIGSLLDAFQSLNKPITMTRISDWVTETRQGFTDTLSLADFAAAYKYFFSPESKMSSASSEWSQSGRFMALSLSQIATQTLQEERWTGNHHQVVAFIQRLCAGKRSNNTKTIIGNIRDAFESLDKESTASVSISSVGEMFKGVEGINVAQLATPLRAFTEHINLQRRQTFSLPEVFEYFGSYIEEAGEGHVTVNDSFLLLNQNYQLHEVRAIGEKVLDIIEKILHNPKEPKYWSLNINSEVILR
jgi:Ca2+-binding EF-hand superfamily protein